MKILDLIRQRRGAAAREPERPAPKVPRRTPAPNGIEVAVDEETPSDPLRPAVFVLSDADTDPILDWSLRREVEVHLHRDTYRFLSALRRHLDAGGEVAAVVVDQIVPKFLFLTLLAHLDREEALARVPVVYLRGSSQVAVFVDGELRQTRPLVHRERERIVAETVSQLVARRLADLGIPVAPGQVRARVAPIMGQVEGATN